MSPFDIKKVESLAPNFIHFQFPIPIYSFLFKAEKDQTLENHKPPKSKKVKKQASPHKDTSKKVKRSSVPKKKLKKPAPPSNVAKSNGKQSIRQRPHLLPGTLNDNRDVSSSDDEDDQAVKSVATQSRITYAIAMNDRMVQEGCSSSGSNGDSSSGGANAISEPATTAQEGQCRFGERYPKRNIRAVNYNEELDTPSDDHFICK